MKLIELNILKIKDSQAFLSKLTINTDLIKTITLTRVKDYKDDVYKVIATVPTIDGHKNVVYLITVKEYERVKTLLCLN